MYKPDMGPLKFFIHHAEIEEIILKLSLKIAFEPRAMWQEMKSLSYMSHIKNFYPELPKLKKLYQ